MSENRKTERVLIVFHLLKYCGEVTFKEVTDITTVSKKTVYRDICLLKQIGFQIAFDRKTGAFTMQDERQPPCFPENKTQKKYLQRILRLIEIMTEIDKAKPDAWYSKTYPELSVRTMQRDFKILSSIGYEITYERGTDAYGVHRDRYYCSWPFDEWDIHMPGQRSTSWDEDEEEE